MPIARGVATCSKQSTNLLYGYGRELLKNEEYRANSQHREFSGMQRYTTAWPSSQVEVVNESSVKIKNGAGVVDPAKDPSRGPLARSTTAKLKCDKALTTEHSSDRVAASEHHADTRARFLWECAPN